MFNKTQVSVATAMLVAGLALAAGSAHAQDTQRVEITGSSIKRIAAEGALPVITLSKDDIAKSGATSARELIQQLPSMQGFTSASDSVNGGGGGTTTASLRNLGSIYTLVLLNGRRIAPFNTGSTVNLEQLPLAAIERVEILADGASALYGADAIAGVVNFITKKNTTSGGIDISASVPQKKGGKESQASISKGFGDLDRDGFNVLAGVSFEKVDKIAANEREFSKSGVIPFEHGGRKLYFWQLSVNANPPNVELYRAPNPNDPTDDGFLDFYAPTLITSGNCGGDPAAFRQGDTCRFDYASTVEAQPEAERKNLFLSGQFKLGKDITAFAEALLSDNSLTGRYAPPAQPAVLPVNGTLYNRHVLPTLAGRGIDPAEVTDAFYYIRLRDTGLRANEYATKGKHLSLGLEGSAFGFDGSFSVTRSRNDITDNFAGGYASDIELTRLIDNNLFDPFAQGTGAPSPAAASAVLTGEASNTLSQLDIVSFKASRPVFNLGGGSAYLGFGADLMKQRYAENPSPISMGPNVLQPDYPDFPVGSVNGALPFDTKRSSTGAYAELLLPLSKSLEVTGSVRYDSFDAAENSKNFDSTGALLNPATQGNKATKSTYKVGLRFQPSPELLLRASIGTGFRPPTLKDITDPLKDFGVIGTQRACPVTAGDPLFPGCRIPPTQYKLQTGGNALTGDAGLKPENSTQWTMGVRFEPSTALSLGAEVWSVKVDDVITAVPEDTAFDNFATYRPLFSVTIDAATQRPILTYNSVPVNGATAKSTGVDLDITGRIGTPIGRLTAKAMATYLIESYFDYGFGGGKESSIGKLGTDDQVAFRTLLKLQASLETGAFTNTFTLSWKPGYLDQTYTAADGTVRLRNEDGSPGAFTSIDDFRVPDYTTVDWQGRWAVTKGLTLTAGVKNLFDKKPPLSIKTVGGNMVGFDPRYADGRGRTFQLSGSYQF
jgi:iron complex outermembrane receptor protein